MKSDAAGNARAWKRLPGKRWLFLVVLAGALAVAVPVAWATFTDVPPSNPFYADINAIQGAGVTSGCGGGNFCPTDNITRQAEAAFVHRAAPRVAAVNGGEQTVPASGNADLAAFSIDVGGVAGNTQFLVIHASVDSFIRSTSGCPCETDYYISDNAGTPVSNFFYAMNDTVGAAGYGDEVTSIEAVVPVPTGTTQTFHLKGETFDGSGTVTAYGSVTAMTAPFGSTGAGTLGVTGQIVKARPHSAK